MLPDWVICEVYTKDILAEIGARFIITVVFVLYK